jgi:transposase
MRRHIPSSVKEQLVVMSGHMHPSHVARITGVNIRTVQRVTALALQTGSVVRRPLQAGRPRELNALDANVGSNILYTSRCLAHNFDQFLEACIQRTPDIYIEELQQKLQDARHIHVSRLTIARTLKRCGFTRKQVSCLHFILCLNSR